MLGAERSDPNYRDVVLEGRLRQALVRLNPDLPAEALEDAYRKLTRTDAPSLVERNRAVHRMLVDGVTVEYRRTDGSIAGAQAQGDRLRRRPTTTTGWPSTSSPSPRGSTRAGRTWCCSSTGCRWR